jgi:CheY-like chemotaxis protein
MLRVLVVDEDPVSRKHAAETLRCLDCTVRTVGEPSTALAAIRHVRFDAVLVSASLPHMTATAFVDALHREERLAMVPVIVTAVTPRAAIDAIRAGARGCIRKPVDVGGVVSVLPPLLKDREHPGRRLSAAVRHGAKRRTAG